MAISIVGTSTRQAGTAVATLTFATPTGLANGDYLVVGILAKTINTNWSPPTADAANWTTLYDSQATAPAVRVYGRKWHTGDPTSFIFTGSSGSTIGYIVGLHSTLGADFIGLDAAANSTRLTSLTLSYPAETASLATDISVLFAAASSTEATFSTPTSYTTQVGFLSQGTGGTTFAAACFTRILTASGSIAPASTTLGTSAANVGAHLLLMEQAPAQSLAGAARSDSAASATLTQTAVAAQSLVGRAESSSSASGSLTQGTAPQALAGGASSVSVAGGALTQTAQSPQAMIGGASAVSAASGALTQTAVSPQPLAGAARSASAAAGLLTQAGVAAQSLIGSGASASTASGTLTNGLAGQALAGAARSASYASATLTQEMPASQAFVGAATTATAASGTLTQTGAGAQPLVGAAIIASAASGSLTVVAPADIALVGAAMSESSAIGTLSVIAAIATDHGFLAISDHPVGSLIVADDAVGALAVADRVVGMLTIADTKII